MKKVGVLSLVSFVVIYTIGILAIPRTISGNLNISILWLSFFWTVCVIIPLLLMRYSGNQYIRFAARSIVIVIALLFIVALLFAGPGFYNQMRYYALNTDRREEDFLGHYANKCVALLGSEKFNCQLAAKLKAIQDNMQRIENPSDFVLIEPRIILSFVYYSPVGLLQQSLAMLLPL